MTYINPEQLAMRLEKRMAEDIADARIGGAGLCVMQGGKVLYKKYHGLRHYAAETPLTAENGDSTMFRLASMSKPITAVAALIQVSRGAFDLDEPIERLLPAFSEMNIGELDEEGNIRIVGPARHKLTPRILLNHTNGVGSMPVGDKQFGAMTREDKQDIAHVVACIEKSVLAFEPTEGQMYSPVWAFDVIARMIELTSGVDYASFLKKNIFEPVGMPDTTFAPTDEQWSRMISMHNRVERVEKDGKFVCGEVPRPAGCVFEDFPVTWFSGGAGLASTLPDYVRFAEMLRRRGVTESGERIVPAALIEEMGRTVIPEHIMPYGERWGLGVRVIMPTHPWMPAGCFGWSGAYGTHFWVDPTNDLTAVLMRNSAYDGGAGAVAACNFEKDVYGYEENGGNGENA